MPLGWSHQNSWYRCVFTLCIWDDSYNRMRVWPNTIETKTFRCFFCLNICYGGMLLLLSRFSCVWLCDPIDGSLLGSPVPGILQARTLEWVAISFSNAWKWKVKVKSLSRVRLFVTPWTAAHQAPPSIGFSRQEYWSGLPLPSPYDGIVLY